MSGARTLAASWRAGLLGGLLTISVLAAGCVVDFDATEANLFSCRSNSDCIAPNICVDEVCKPRPPEVEDECIDEDGDGYGEGDACLGPDCNDADNTIFPGAQEICDGKDNDCDCVESDSCDQPALEIIDEVTECAADEDCVALEEADGKADNGVRCVEGQCMYRCPLDTVGVCGTAGPDGGGAVRACETTVDEANGTIRGDVPVCALIGAYGPDYDPGPENMEACDGLDNNCNRAIDMNPNCQACNTDTPRQCSTDLGVCDTGIVLCQDNVPVDCVDPETMQPVIQPGDQMEVCDGLDNDCNGVVDDAPATPTIASSICPDRCPFGMVLLNNGQDTWCMDRFEASRPDATIDSPGTDDSRAVSRPGVLPWTGLTLTDARDACRGPAGITFPEKRLCSLDELGFACGGNNDLFPYGANYTPNTCNGADAGLGTLAPTGPTEPQGDQDFAACVSTRGQATLYDLSGNVSEFALQDNLGKIFGGSFLSDGNSLTCRSSFDGQGPGVDVGFRCCFDP